MDHRRIAGHPLAAVWAAFLAVSTGRPADAERWADVVERWQHEDGKRPDDPATEAWRARSTASWAPPPRSQAIARSRQLTLLEGP